MNKEHEKITENNGPICEAMDMVLREMVKEDDEEILSTVKAYIDEFDKLEDVDLPDELLERMATINDEAVKRILNESFSREF